MASLKKHNKFLVTNLKAMMILKLPDNEILNNLKEAKWARTELETAQYLTQNILHSYSNQEITVVENRHADKWNRI